MNKENCPLISVIIPVYNTEKYLKRCVDSIGNQTYQNIEIVVINNGSAGNVSEMVSTFKQEYSRITFKIVEHTENVGLFRARVSGVKVANGKYIAFVDSDDRISTDFYAQLVQQAERTKSDIVGTDFVNEHEDRYLSGFSLDHFFLNNYDLYGNEVANAFFGSEGRSSCWFSIWNKIYSMELWKQCIPFFDVIQEPIVLGEDVLFSMCLFAKSKHFTNIHGVYYYYFIRTDANSRVDSVSSLEKRIMDLSTALSYAKKFLLQCGLYDNVACGYENFCKLHGKFNVGNVSRAKLSMPEKKKLLDLIEKLFGVTEAEDNSDSFFYMTQRQNENREDECVRAIVDKKTEYVSFDVFDTLLLRPFWEPRDLFKLLDKPFEDKMQMVGLYPFSEMREYAEVAARKMVAVKHPGWQDISLSEIYQQICDDYQIDERICSEMMQEELKLEMRFCRERKWGKRLYNIAKNAGKRVIITSDSYFPKNFILELLDKCGYERPESVFISNETGVLKSTGDMYDYLLDKLEIEKEFSSSVLHIGDNVTSDIHMASSRGLQTFYVPNTHDAFCNIAPQFYFGNSFLGILQSHNAYDQCDRAFAFTGFRCALEVVANEIFDNPLRPFQKDSDFNEDPYFVGFYAMGMSVFALANWISSEVTKSNYKKVFFVGRDGYLVKKAYDCLRTTMKHLPQSEYLETSRKAMLPILIEKAEDFYQIDNNFNISTFSPEIFLDVFYELTDVDAYSQRNDIFESENVKANKCFTTKEGFVDFIRNVYIPHFFSPVRVNNYRTKVCSYFSDVVGLVPNSVLFDVGYSGRTELALSKLMGFPVNGLYLHMNSELCKARTKKAGCTVKTFFEYMPRVCGDVREFLLSDCGQGCEGYHITKQGVAVRYTNDERDFTQNFAILIAQEAAINFVKSMCNTFGENISGLKFRYNDFFLPLEYYLNFGKDADRAMFSTVRFTDKLNRTQPVDLLEIWKLQCSEKNITHNITAKPAVLIKLPKYETMQKWEKFIYLWIVDREKLWKKLKKKLGRR